MKDDDQLFVPFVPAQLHEEKKPIARGQNPTLDSREHGDCLLQSAILLQALAKLKGAGRPGDVVEKDAGPEAPGASGRSRSPVFEAFGGSSGPEKGKVH